MVQLHMKIKIQYLLPVIPFIGFIAGYGLSNLLISTTTHQAPNIIGLTLHEAIKITSQNHVTIQLIAEKECNGILPGTILTQKPAAGRLIKPNQAILVTASKQQTLVPAPKLLSKKTQDIQITCKQLGIKIKEYPIVSTTPQGYCVGQIPQPDTPLTDKKMIFYTAKNQANIYIMPNFIGKRLHESLQSIQRHQLPVTISHQHQEIKPPYQQNYQIVAQKPRPGSFISLEEKLNIQLEVEAI